MEKETKRSAQSVTSEREEAEKLLTDLRQRLDSVRGKVASAEALLQIRTAELPDPSGKSVALKKRLEEDPAYTPFRKHDLRRNILLACGEILNQSSLSAEKLEKLKQLLEEKNNAVQDTLEIVGNPVPGNMTSFGRLATMRTQTSFDLEIHDLVGDDLYHDIKYSYSYRMLDAKVRELEARLADRGLPALTDEQQHTLKAAYRSATYPQSPGEEKNPVIGGQYGPETEAAVEARVAGILSPAQFAALTEYHRDYRTQTEIMSRANKQVYEASVRSGQ